MRDPKNPFGDRVERKLSGAGSTTNTGGMTLDVLVTPDQYLIEVDVPGIAADDIKLSIEDGELTIEAVRRRPEQAAPRKDYAFIERKFGELTRTISLPGVYGSIAAKTLADGVLTIAVGRKGAHEQLS